MKGVKKFNIGRMIGRRQTRKQKERNKGIEEGNEGRIEGIGEREHERGGKESSKISFLKRDLFLSRRAVLKMRKTREKEQEERNTWGKTRDEKSEEGTRRPP